MLFMRLKSSPQRQAWPQPRLDFMRLKSHHGGAEVTETSPCSQCLCGSRLPCFRGTKIFAPSQNRRVSSTARLASTKKREPNPDHRDAEVTERSLGAIGVSVVIASPASQPLNLRARRRIHWLVAQRSLRDLCVSVVRFQAHEAP